MKHEQQVALDKKVREQKGKYCIYCGKNPILVGHYCDVCKETRKHWKEEDFKLVKFEKFKEK